MNDTTDSTEPTPPAESAPDPAAAHRSPALIAAAVALPVAVIVGILVAAVIAGRNPVLDPVALGPVPAPESGSPQCTRLLDSMPETLGDFTRAELVDPAPEGAAAWQSADGQEIVLRCGLDRPLEFDAAGALQVVNGVQWFEVPGDEGMGVSTWFAVDRGVYVAATIPHGLGPTPLQDASTALAVLPAQPIDPAPIEVPAPAPGS